MYKSELHQILVESLKGCTWTRSTKNEDNFRQVLCASIYKHISEDNVEIPSTYSGDGDIQLFGRKVELKYSSVDKREKIESIIEDFELLLDSEIEFSIVAMRIGVAEIENHLRCCVAMPKLNKKGGNAHFGVKNHGAIKYHQVSVFLSATYPHALKQIDDPSNKGKVAGGKGNKSTSYLSFESAPALLRSSFLKVHNNYIHVDVLGSREDGLICFLFKKANHVKLNPSINQVPATSIAIPYSGGPLEIAKATSCDVFLDGGKEKSLPLLGRIAIEQNVIVFDISA